MIKTDIGGGDADHIRIRGLDLVDDLLDKHDFVDVLCLAILGKFPDERPRKLVNRSLITAIDHGLTPSALAVARALSDALGRPMPLNATGSKAAALLDLGLTPEFGKGLTLIGRTAGLVAHVIEERSRPIGQDLWDMAAAESERAAS